MKKILVATALLLAGYGATAQFVAKLEVTEEVKGICDKHDVYTLLPMFKGQVEAACPVSKEGLEYRLNSGVPFLADNPKYKDEGMIGLYINCKGQVVKCKMDNKTKNPELNQQIETVFSNLGEWKAGTLNGHKVDSYKLFSFKIKKGKLVIN